MATETKRKKHRRGNGEGSIYERPDGRWSATITTGRSETGKRIRRTVYGKTKRDVLASLAELKHDSLKGTLTEPNRATVAEYLRDWLGTSCKPSVRASTHANYRNAIENHIVPVIGGVRLQALTPMHVQSLYAKLGERLTPKTIRTAAIVLGKALTQAVKFRFIKSDPSKDVKAPAIPNKEMQVLSAEQARKFLETAKDDRLYALYLLALTTGMRVSELAGLQWQDVDFEGKRVSVVRTATYVACKLTVDAPKTRSSRRVLNVSGSVIAALNDRRRLAMVEGLAACPWVFPSLEGNPFWRTNLHRYSFKPILRRAELPDVRFHDLRHTCASLLLSEGVSAKIVQELLGHANVGITLGTYGHVMPGMHEQATNRMESLLSGPIDSQKAVKTG